MLTKSQLFDIIQEVLLEHNIDTENANEISDSLVEVLDENGLWEEEVLETVYD
jgi:hypothetical protein